LPKSGRRAWHHCRMSSRKHRHHRAVRWRHKTNVLAPGLTDLNSQVGAGTDVKGYLIRAATKAGRPRASVGTFFSLHSELALPVSAPSPEPVVWNGGLGAPRRGRSVGQAGGRAQHFRIIVVGYGIVSERCLIASPSVTSCRPPGGGDRVVEALGPGHNATPQQNRETAPEPPPHARYQLRPVRNRAHAHTGLARKSRAGEGSRPRRSQMVSEPLRWDDDKAGNPPWIRALAEVRRLAPREGWCYEHVQAIILSIDQYAEKALGTGTSFLNRRHSIGGSRKSDIPCAGWSGERIGRGGQSFQRQLFFG